MFMSNGCLTLVIELNVMAELVNTPTLFRMPLTTGHLADDLAKYRNIATDVEIRVRNIMDYDNVLTTKKAHRVILCARSPFFMQLLNEQDSVSFRNGAPCTLDITKHIWFRSTYRWTL